jgi:hypothetical protein
VNTALAAVVVGCALEAADRVIVEGVPGVSVIIVGDAVTPGGNPDICPETCDVKPFSAVAANEVVEEDPATMETELGDADNEKSGVDGGGGGCPPPPPPPLPPQLEIPRERKSKNRTGQRSRSATPRVLLRWAIQNSLSATQWARQYPYNDRRRQQISSVS